MRDIGACFSYAQNLGKNANNKNLELNKQIEESTIHKATAIISGGMSAFSILFFVQLLPFIFGSYRYQGAMS